MIDRKHALPLVRQARELGISRGSVYYLPRPVSPADLAIMRRIDELHLEFPFAGSRMLRDLLRQEGTTIGRLHVASLMKKMAIEAIYRRPNTSKPSPGHKIYPYLLRGLLIVRPNQVWATDISYIPMAKGFVYLVAIVDWFSRKVLAWRVSITMQADFCVEALEDALGRYGNPEIFNTDQGSQFTGMAFTGVLLREKVAISVNRRPRRDPRDHAGKLLARLKKDSLGWGPERCRLYDNSRSKTSWISYLCKADRVTLWTPIHISQDTECID